MKLLGMAAFALTLASGAIAQTNSPEIQAMYDYRACVTKAAQRFSVLDQPLSEIASAAMAVCNGEFETFRQVVNQNVNLPQRRLMFDFARDSARNDAVVIAVEAKMSAQ